MVASNLSEILRIEGRATDARLEVIPYYWDPVGLAYVVAQQAGGGAGGGGAATIADGADVAQGATTDAESAAGNGSVVALLKRLRTLLSNPLAVTGTFWQVTQPISATALPLPAGASTGAKQDTGNTSVASIDTKTPADPAREGGNLATLAAKDFATGAKQDTALATLTAIDTDLKAELGTVGTIPGAFTVLDRLNLIGSKIDSAAKAAATEVTMKRVLAALSKPLAPSYSTLLHR